MRTHTAFKHPLLWTLGLLSLAAVAQTGLPQPPVAPVRPVTDTLHGVAVADPYRYFENVKDPVVAQWLRGQGDAARAALDRISVRDALEQRITEIGNASGDAVRDIMRMPGERTYYLKRARGEKQFKLMRRQGKGAEVLLVDPEREAQRTGVPHAINYYKPSWDGHYLAYGLSAGGSEDASLHIVDMASGKAVAPVFPRVHEDLVHWAPDSRSLTFNQLKELKPGEPDSETFLDSRVLWLRIGQTQATPLFGPTVTPKLGLERLDNAEVMFTPGSPWMIARTTDTTLPEGKLYRARVSELGRKTVAWKQISGFADKITQVDWRGNDLYLLTYNQAPRNRVMQLDLRQADLKTAREVATAPADGVLEHFALTRDGLYGSVRQGTSIVLRRYAKGQPLGAAIAMPYAGAAVVHADPAHSASTLLYTLLGWTSLPRIFVLDGERSTDAGLVAAVTPPSLPEVQITELQVKSHDGVLVPMTVLHKKGLALDGRNPTLLRGYGGYGFSETARFSPSDMAWIERGGVLALANIRGSGVYGRDWYQAGFKASKPNTWKDGVACAQALIARGYASPQTLGVMGTSAGGIFVGRVITSAPQLFAAAVFNVGVMDAVRAEESANGITNISEFGSFKNPAEFPALLEMSTYHQIKDSTAYPAVLLVHGLNDPRVDVWHSAKATARLQAASTSGKPVLLRLDAQAGHGVGSTANQRYAQDADIFGFLLWQMGQVGLKD